MPSASAKIEKVASPEATDAVKQIVNMFEKRVRNLEKRKIKLDNYRNDVLNGKELNEDQKMAVSKYDQVEGNLEFAKEFSKSMNGIINECARAQKKQAKKEALERTQREVQRLQEAFVFRHLLSCFRDEDVRSHFLNGDNGAVQLTSEELSQLDQFYKLIGFGLPNEQEDMVNHFHVLAENLIFLVEGKNKEIAGTTYKVLKDLLRRIKDSGYFSRPSEPLEEDAISSDDLPEEESANEKAEQSEEFSGMEDADKVQPPALEEQIDANNDEGIAVNEIPEEVVPELQNGQTGPLEVLASEATFNFLQESQIDLDTPHMDPAVVAVHQMAPQSGNTYIEPYPDKPVNGEPVLVATPTLAAVPIATMEFDPTIPIPTQTYTNQSFAVMQNMMIPPQGYVSVAMHHRGIPPPPHLAVVPGISPPAPTSPPALVHIAPIPLQVVELESIEAPDTAAPPQTNGGEEAGNETDRKVNGYGDRTSDGNGPIPYRGGFRGRGRGRGNNNYFRGRNNYHNNNNWGGYQNRDHHYQDRDRNGYRGNFRRGNNQGPRGGYNNNRGRGNYRQQQQQQPQQSSQQTTTTINNNVQQQETTQQ